MSRIPPKKQTQISRDVNDRDVNDWDTVVQDAMILPLFMSITDKMTLNISLGEGADTLRSENMNHSHQQNVDMVPLTGQNRDSGLLWSRIRKQW